MLLLLHEHLLLLLLRHLLTGSRLFIHVIGGVVKTVGDDNLFQSYYNSIFS